MGAKQNAATAINTSNIGSQSVTYATSAGTANSASNAIGNLGMEITSIFKKINDNNSSDNYDFLMRRSTSSHGRANNSYYFLYPGIYETSTNTNGAADYGAILVIRPYSNWVFQTWFTTSGHIYTRRNINSEGFTSWELIK